MRVSIDGRSMFTLSNIKLRHLLVIGSIISAFILTSCAAQRVVVYCEPSQTSIYIDGFYQGDGIVHYSIPKGQKFITISCYNGNEYIVTRKFCTKELPRVISIYLDEYKSYSVTPKTLITY